MTSLTIGTIAAPATAAWLFGNPVGFIGGAIFGVCHAAAGAAIIHVAGGINNLEKADTVIRVVAFIATCGLGTMLAGLAGVDLTLKSAVVLALQSCAVGAVGGFLIYGLVFVGIAAAVVAILRGFNMGRP